MSSFTPGPWKVIEGCSPIYNQLIGISASETSHIGVVSEDHTAQPSQWKANARLIASAPDLLEALKGLLRTHDDPADPESAVAMEREIRLVENARAAVAKAEGRDE